MEDFVLTETGESPEAERNRLYNRDKEEDFGKLDTDRVVQGSSRKLFLKFHKALF